MFWDNLWVPSSRDKKYMNLDFLTLEDGTDNLPRNVGAELSLYAV
jgi:hypothetical protein